MSNSGHVRRGLVLAICCMSIRIVGLDVTILNVALPAIQKDFGASVSGAQWTIDAYTLVIACLLMLSGSMGDRFGRRRTFQVGLATFTVGSLLCSIAPGLGWLIAFRAVQAIEGPVRGWGSPVIVGSFLAAAAALAGLLRVESRRAEPLLDPRFFTSIPFSAATLTAVAAFAAFAGFLFLNALYLQDVRGYSPLHAGLLTLPMAAMTAVLPPISGRIVARRGARLPLVIGGVGIAAGGCLLLPLDASTPLVLLFVAYVVFGVGFGLINAPITNAAVSGMPVAQAGVAAGVASTSRQVGSALGVAVLGSLVTSQLATSFGDFAAAARPAWVVVIGCGLVVVALGVVGTTERARATARRTAERFAVPAPAVAPSTAG